MYVVPKKIKFKQANLDRVVGFRISVEEFEGAPAKTKDLTLEEIGAPDPDGYYVVDIDGNDLRPAVGVMATAYVAALGAPEDGQSGFESSAPFQTTEIPEPPAAPSDVNVA